MFKRISLMAMALVAGLGVTYAGGGRIRWADGSSDKDFEKLAAECRASGTPMMLLFTSSMCPACQDLDSGSLRDDAVVQAARKLVCVLAGDGKMQSASKKFGIKSIPTMIFCDPEGNEVARMTDRSTAGLVKQFNEVALKHTRAPKWAESLEKAVEAAREGKRPAVVYYADEGQKSQLMEKAFSDLALADYLEKFAWAKVKLTLKSDEARQLGITSLPAIWILDARGEEAKPLKKLGAKAPAALRTEFKDLLKSYKVDGTETK